MAFGEIAVGERRSLWDTPSKSGVLGIVAACMGLDRDRTSDLAQLNQHLGFAARVDREGTLMRDYHTAQTPTEASRTKRQKQGSTIDTRAEDLLCDDLKTVLSERYYRLEARFVAALWVKPNVSYSLEDVKAALLNPVFTPYLGRKSCPIGAPILPILVESHSLLNAFQLYDQAPNQPVPPPRTAPVWFEWSSGLDEEETLANMVRERRDALRRRASWHFNNRKEGRLFWNIEGAIS